MRFASIFRSIARFFGDPSTFFSRPIIMLEAVNERNSMTFLGMEDMIISRDAIFSKKLHYSQLIVEFYFT